MLIVFVIVYMIIVCAVLEHADKRREEREIKKLTDTTDWSR